MAVLVPNQLPGVGLPLFKLISANMNVTTDQTFVPIIPAVLGQRYIIDRILCLNASTSLTTAAGGIYDTASKGGNALIANSQAYSALTGATLALDLTLAAVGKAVVAGVAPILSLTTGQGSAATADFFVFGRLLTGLY